MELNKIYNEDNITFIKRIPDDFVDLTVTSPPYDNLRDYKGYVFDFETLAKELYRVTKPGGVVVWVVGDATVNGSETGTSFRQALKFMELGFNLHDTMIYSKGGQGATGSNKAYWQDFEYMFVLVKEKIKCFNPIEDRRNVVKPRRRLESQGHRLRSGETKGQRIIERKEYGRRMNIWTYHESGTRTDHPAVFPIQLAKDHIISWSDKGDLVFDPFMGSGTTAVAALDVGRKYIGVEIAKEYVEIANERIKNHTTQTELFDFM